MKLSILANKYRKLVRSLDVHPEYKVFYTKPTHSGSPHIEEDNGLFNFVITERGHECKRIDGLTADDILYLLLESATSFAAIKYELKNRKDGVDSRSVWFPYQEELMANFSQEWSDRLRKKHEAILKDYPFSSKCP